MGLRFDIHFASTITISDILPLLIERTIETTADGRVHESVINRYGYKLNWLVRFRVLPHVGFNLNQEWVTGTSAEEESLGYGALLRKRFSLGRTKNDVQYTFSTRERTDHFREKIDGDDSNVLTFSSTAVFLPQTRLAVGATKYVTNQWYEDENINQSGVGANLDISSGVGETFSQRHAYTFTEVERDTVSNGRSSSSGPSTMHNYNGRMTFVPFFCVKSGCYSSLLRVYNGIPVKFWCKFK